MNDLDELEATLLSRARRAYAPSPASQARVHNATLSALAAGAVVPLSTPSTTLSDLAESVRDGLTLPRALVAIAALGSAGGGGYALGLREGLARAPVVAPSAPVSVATSTPRAEGLPAPQERGAAPLLPRPETKRSTPPAAPSVTAAPSSAASELELGTLRRVERVLREGNPRFALALLSDLDKSAPRGNFMEERRAAHAVATCQLEPPTVAATTASAFHARYPGSVYEGRVREACATATQPSREQNVAPAETDAHKEEHSP
jgi:hypothetical protein